MSTEKTKIVLAGTDSATPELVRAMATLEVHLDDDHLEALSTHYDQGNVPPLVVEVQTHVQIYTAIVAHEQDYRPESGPFAISALSMRGLVAKIREQLGECWKDPADYWTWAEIRAEYDIYYWGPDDL